MTETPFRTPYPDYDVLEKWDSPSWNAQTRRAVAARLVNVPPRRFFDEAAFALLEAIVETILPQPERARRDRVPIAERLDAMLHENPGWGTRFAGLPPLQEAWTIGIAAIGAEARARHGRDFAALSEDERGALLKAVDAGETDAALWHGMPPRRFFRDGLLTQAVRIYYSYPQAWNEIGFGGPASPRGYVRLGFDERDPWEATERRRPQAVEDLE